MRRAAVERRAIVQGRLGLAVDGAALRRRSRGPAGHRPRGASAWSAPGERDCRGARPPGRSRDRAASVSSRKPITSASSGGPASRWISATAPTGAGKPAAAIVMPTVCGDAARTGPVRHARLRVVACRCRAWTWWSSLLTYGSVQSLTLSDSSVTVLPRSAPIASRTAGR